MLLHKSLSPDGILDGEQNQGRSSFSKQATINPAGRFGRRAAFWKVLVRYLVALGFLNLGLQLANVAHAAVPLWERVEPRPENAGRYTFDFSPANSLLSQSKTEFPLPMPDGVLAIFQVENSNVMPPELAARFPEVRSFTGQMKGEPQTRVKLDFSFQKLTAKIFTPNKTIHIFQPTDWGGHYVSIEQKDLERNDAFACRTPLDGPRNIAQRLASMGVERGGRYLRTYRIAIAATGEFTQANGGTVAGAMSTIVNTLNQVNGIYERELGIRFQLVPNNDRLVFTNPHSDPYSANDANTTTLIENQNATDSIIGSGNYDIGHFFNTGAFGLAYSGVVCREGWKARGGFGFATPGVGATFFADLVAHEIAHQFGANHTFNSSEGMCGAARNPSTAYEPGSGSTLMAYAGFCDGNNLQDHNDTYFHAANHEEIMRFVTTDSGANCAVVTETGNNPPMVETTSHYTIPKGTAFRLAAKASDPDGDAVTYCWEQMNRGPAQSIYDGDNGQSALFRSYPPTPNPGRTFPRMDALLRNEGVRGETPPQTARTLNFRVTARDNRGGVATADAQVMVTESGPFYVTSHAWHESYSGVQTITWETGGTASAPVNASHVNILLSTNGGGSFNVVLAANVPNDGLERVLFPNLEIPSARLKIEAVGNIFFAVNQSSFTIRPYLTVPDFNMDGKVDLLWQTSSGRLQGWIMNGSTFLRGMAIRNNEAVARQWRLAGMFDFNADARVDLLWQHSNGATMVWFMDGPHYLSAKRLRNGFQMASGWRAISAGDFDGDAQPDILWQHTNGRLVVWKMNGSDFVQNVQLQGGKPAGPGWRAVSLSDFNSDAEIDILFRHDDGRLATWLMNGFSVKRNVILNTPAMNASWRLGALGDLDGNGQNDIIWHHTDGTIRVWYMAGLKVLRTGSLRTGKMDPQWNLLGPR